MAQLKQLLLGFCLLVLSTCSHGAALELQHSLDGGHTWSSAGSLNGNIKLGDLTLVRTALSDADSRKLQALAENDQLYLVRVGPAATSFVRASCWAAAPSSETLTLAVTGGEVTGLQYTVSSPTCSSPVAAGTPVQLPAATFPVTVAGPVVGPSLYFDRVGAARATGAQGAPGSSQQRVGAAGGGGAGIGATNRPLGVMPGSEGAAQGDNAAGEQQPPQEQTWLQKNWLFVVGGVMIGMNVMTAMGRQAAQQGGAAPAAGGGGARR